MQITDEMVKAGARALVPFALGRFEDQERRPSGQWSQPPLTPNERAWEAARACLTAALAAAPGREDDHVGMVERLRFAERDYHARCERPTEQGEPCCIDDTVFADAANMLARLTAAPGRDGGLADLTDQALVVLRPSDLGNTDQYRRDRISALLNAAFNRGYATSKTVKT